MFDNVRQVKVFEIRANQNLRIQSRCSFLGYVAKNPANSHPSTTRAEPTHERGLAESRSRDVEGKSEEALTGKTSASAFF